MDELEQRVAQAQPAEQPRRLQPSGPYPVQSTFGTPWMGGPVLTGRGGQDYLGQAFPESGGMSDLIEDLMSGEGKLSSKLIQELIQQRVR